MRAKFGVHMGWKAKKINIFMDFAKISIQRCKPRDDLKKITLYEKKQKIFKKKGRF